MVTTQSKMHPRATRPLAVGKINDRVVLMYEKIYNNRSQLYINQRDDDGNFTSSPRQIDILAHRGRLFELSDNSSCRLTQIGRQIIFSTTQNSHLVFANTHASKNWQANILSITKPPKSIKGPGVFVSNYLFEGQIVLLSGSGDIKINFSERLGNWHGHEHTILRPRTDHFDDGRLSPIMAEKISQGILLLYTSTTSKKTKHHTSIGAALLASDDPGRVLWRSEVSLGDYKSIGKDKIQFLGGFIEDDTIQLYWSGNGKKLALSIIPNPFYEAEGLLRPIHLRRHHKNPLLSPRDNGWETIGVFNPAVLQDKSGKIHIMYRALDAAGISYLGYASSEDGFTIDHRTETPAYWPREEWEAGGVTGPGWSDAFGSGGGWGGCEDPKLTEIDGMVYLTYVGHNGNNPPRIAISKLPLEDFIAHNWHKWSKPRLISEPGVVNKSGVILPEKIGGKYVVFHRVFPNILLDWRDNLDFDSDNRWLNSHAEIPIRPHRWDSRKLSIGATPIRIRDGWLVIYHAVDDRDSARYKIGAMILDADDPSKVLYRTNQPILTPQATYENDWKFGIAYPSGAAIKDGTLLVYYGGGDKFVCVATANLEKFVADLKREKEISLTNKNISFGVE